MENVNAEITNVGPNEIDEAKYRQLSCRFDCLVRIFDSGNRSTRGMFLSPLKALPPQWFKSEFKLTMEAVEHSDPYTLGMAIKQAYSQLKHHIEQYEAFKP